MAGVEVRAFEAPDEELADLELVHAVRVNIAGRDVWRFTFEPGWHYTEHFRPELCDVPHVGYIAAGRLHVVMEDGTEAEAGPGQALVIAPGHDAWTVGDEACVFVDFAAAVAADEDGEPAA